VRALIFSFIFPFLLMTALLQGACVLVGRPMRGWIPALVLSLIAAGIVLIPVEGYPIGRWLISFNANFSIPLTALLLSAVLKAFFGMQLLDGQARAACWIFSIMAGAGLYPMALGLGRMDPYTAGWGFSWLFVLVFSATLVLLALKNRFAVVLIVAILAYDLQLLESSNLWDYLIDPILVLVSCIGMAGWIVRKAVDGPRRKT